MKDRFRSRSDDGAGASISWTRRGAETSSVCLIRVFFPSEITPTTAKRSNSRESDVAPEHFARVRQRDTMKWAAGGCRQIAQEGAIQIFQEYNTGMEEVIVAGRCNGCPMC